MGSFADYYLKDDEDELTPSQKAAKENKGTSFAQYYGVTSQKIAEPVIEAVPQEQPKQEGFLTKAASSVAEFAENVWNRGVKKMPSIVAGGLGTAPKAIIQSTSIKVLTIDNQLATLENLKKFLENDIAKGTSTKAVGFGTMFGGQTPKATSVEMEKKQKNLADINARIGRLNVAKEEVAKENTIDKKLRDKSVEMGSKIDKESSAYLLNKYGTPDKWSGQWIANEVGANVPQFLASFGLGIATSLVTKNPKLGLTVGFSSSYTQEAGGAYQELRSIGVSDSDAQKVAVNTGIANALIEQIPLGRALTKNPAGETVKKNVLKRVTGYLAGRVKDGAFEGGTETMQEIVANAFAMEYDENRQLFDNALESGVFGAILGGGGGTITSMIQGDISKGNINVMDKEVIDTANKAAEEAIATPEESRTEMQQEIVDSLKEETTATSYVENKDVKFREEISTGDKLTVLSSFGRPQGITIVDKISNNQGEKFVVKYDSTPNRTYNIPVKELKKSIKAYQTSEFSKTPTKLMEQQGWKGGDKSKSEFDYALLQKDAETVTKMLPDVPAYYKEKFAKEIDAIVKASGIKYREAPTREMTSTIAQERTRDAIGRYAREGKGELVKKIPIGEIDFNTDAFLQAQGDVLTGDALTTSDLPVLAREYTKGRYVIDDGNHRLAKSLLTNGKLTEVEVITDKAAYEELTKMEETKAPQETAMDLINKYIRSEKFRPIDDFAKKGIKLSQEQENQIMEFNKKFFGDGDIRIVEQIVANQKALGSYKDSIITLLNGKADIKDTFMHEAVHKYLDVFTTREQHIQLLEEGAKKYGINDFAQVEEKIAEDFIAYTKDRTTAIGKIKEIFDKIIGNIKKYLGEGSDSIESLYRDIYEGKAANKGDVEVLTVPKSPTEAIVVPPTQQGLGGREYIVKMSPELTQAVDNRIKNTKSIKDVKSTLGSIQRQLDQSLMEAESMAIVAQERRAGINTEDVATLKLTYSNNRTFQEGDIETIRAYSENSRNLVNRVVENVQEIHPDMSEAEAFDFALNLPTKGDETAHTRSESIMNLKSKERSLSKLLDQLKTRQEKLQLTEDAESLEEFQRALTVRDELVKSTTLLEAKQPVGTGEAKTSRLAERMQEQLLENDPARYEFNEESGKYNELNLEEDAQKAVDFIEKSPKQALAVGLGLMDAPAGQTTNGIALAVALKAKDEGNYKLYAEIVNSTSLRNTRLGQELVTLRGHFNQDSPESFIKQVIDARMEKMGERLVSTVERLTGKGTAKKALTKKIDSEVTKLESKLTFEQKKVRLAQDIIDALRC